MIILERYRLLERLAGLDPLGGRISLIVRIIHLVTFISISAMESIFIILNIHDGIDRAAPALAPLCGIIPGMAYLAHLLMNRERYYSVLNEMQEIVNNRS